MARRWGTIAAGIIGGLLLFVVFVIIFTPATAVQGVVDRALGSAGYTFRASQFGKALPLGIKAGNVEIADGRGVLFKADDAAVRLRLLPLLTGRISFGFRADIRDGEVTGDFSPSRGGKMEFRISKVRLEDIPFFTNVADVRAKGELDAEGEFRGNGSNAAGKARLEIKRLELAGVKIGGMPLPDASYDAVRGALKVAGGRAVLESATLQGEGIYVRLSGDFPVTNPLGAAPLNLTLELMPKPDFLEKQKLVFLLLTRYLVSPGNYRIPIHGTLGRPAIQ
jgi:type II secretion system protein N